MAHIQVYTEKRLLNRRPQYRWRVVAANNRIIATGSEGYYNLSDLWNAVRETGFALGASRRASVPIHDGKPPRV